MKRAIISFLIVITMIFANLFGIVFFIQKEGLKDSFDDFVEKNEVPEPLIEAEENQQHVLSSELGNIEKEDQIPWHLLPKDRNPSARLFLEQSSVGIEFKLPKMTIEQTVEGEIIHLEDGNSLLEPGKPLVPDCRIYVAVPPDSKVVYIKVVEKKSHVLEGYHEIAPYVPQTLDGEYISVEPDPEIYSSSDFFPSSFYEVSGPEKLRHLDALEVVLYPIRVQPALGAVEVFDLLRVYIELETETGEEMLPPSVLMDDSLDRVILDSIANPDDVTFCSSLKDISYHATRAPSTIYHTMGFHGSVSVIHPVKDDTTGNVGGVALLHEDDSQFYVAEAQKTMYIDGFDIGEAESSATLEYAMLHLQYKGTDGYNGSSKVRWALEGEVLQETNIQPTDQDGLESNECTYDLLDHPNSPNVVSDITDLDVEFSENGTGGGSKDIPFDYIWIEFAYREELTGDSDYLIITSLRYADELRPLAEWKTSRLGIDTQVYDLEWINVTCDGINPKERIHDFIQSMFENYNVEWVLLGGDELVIPADISVYDSYYADVVGFTRPDMAIGRLPTHNDAEMEGMVKDILAHQRDLRPWKRNMYLLGTNIFSTGDGRHDMKYLKDNYLDGHDLTYWEDYEVENNITRSRTIDTYNIGMGASTITGHGAKYGWYMDNGTQNFFNKDDVEDDLNNSDKRGFVWSITCSSGGFVGSYVCIGEMWLVARDGGGIGYIGAAEIAFSSPSDALNRAFWRAYDEMLNAKEDPTQGMAHFRAMNTNYYAIYNLFGDPQIGLTIADPNIDVDVGYFDAGNFVEQMGFDQGEQATFKTDIQYPFSALPKGVHINLTVQNEKGDVYFLNEVYYADPEDLEEVIFWNWTVPFGATAGIYNISMRIYNTSQGWEFIYENETYFFVDYDASLIWVEQVNSVVVEGDTVTYRIHIDNFIEPIPTAKVWVQLEGRDYFPYTTPFNYSGSNTTAIPTGSDFVVEIKIPVLEPGTYNVTAGLHIDWALMDSEKGDETEARGIRILEVTFNHPLYFREDTATISYYYFACTGVRADATLDVVDQTNQFYGAYDFLNGMNWLNFTWTVPKYLQNGTYDIDLDITGLGRTLETNSQKMRVVLIREILDKGENWLIPMQQIDGGWEESDVVFIPGSNRNDTARAMQALLWSGVNPSEPAIQEAANFVEMGLDLTYPGEVDELAQIIWGLVDAGRGSSQIVQDSASIFRRMQNWVYEPENWTACFSGNTNDTWLVNISGYDENEVLQYWEKYNGTFENMDPLFVNFTVLPQTVKLNVTINSSALGIGPALLFSPLDYVNPIAWDALWVDDHWGSGDGIEWNCSMSEEIDFDRGWGRKKGMPSIAGFTAWGIIGLLQSGSLGPFEIESLYTGIQWLLENQSADGSWYPRTEDGFMFGGGYIYPQNIVGNYVDDTIQNTALPVIALVMNGTVGQAVDDAVEWLKLQQIEDGSYPYNPWPWAYRINLVSTAHTLRALTRAGYTFELSSSYVREAARWLCASQDNHSGNWDTEQNYTRTTADAMMALAFLKYNRSLDLEPGWNLVSMDLIPTDTSLTEVLGSIYGDYDVVEWYNSTDKTDFWKLYQVTKPPFMNDLNEINLEMGFWVNITNPGGTVFWYIGSEPTRDQEIALHPGWNMVGYPSMNNRDRTWALNNILFGVDVDSIWTYDATTQKWEEIEGSDNFEIGKGYWIYANVEKDWKVPL